MLELYPQLVTSREAHDLARMRRQALSALVARYRDLGRAGHAYSEARVVNDFIIPLFGALGWDVRNEHSTGEVVPEEATSRGRVDWAFRLRGVPQFYLEAKRPSADLSRPDAALQVINYAYNKGVRWAVVSNFERTLVYNAEWDAPNPMLNLFFEVGWEEYPNSERLPWLSREALSAGVLDREAEAAHRRLRKTPVGDRLFGDLLTYRAMLRNYFGAYNPEIARPELDHAVQRLLDRLIFIRTAEDRGIEEYHLRPLVRRLRASERQRDIWPEVLAIFRHFDSLYDSQLFANQRLDALDIEAEPIRVTVEGLYGPPSGSIEYDFSAIDSDVLGGVYEQYLGQLARTADTKAPPVTVQAALEQAARLDTKPFRKSHGVFYTPKWVVRSIVESTVGRALRERTPAEVKRLRILDPACGSGSFLVESFQVLADYWQRTEPPANPAAAHGQRMAILHENIFGIDLDPQAVEITRLNLLLVALNQKSSLPDLRSNIIVANSLVDALQLDDHGGFRVVGNRRADPETTLGAFDVVLGNPPYIRSQALTSDDRDYFRTRFKTARGSFDTYQLFLERALELTARDGRCGFIVPGKFLSASSESWLLAQMYSMANVEELIDATRQRVFEDALTYPVILILRKGQPPSGHRYGLVTSISVEGPTIKWEDRPGRVAPTLSEVDLPSGWVTVGELARVRQGLVTGSDFVFALHGTPRAELSLLRSDTLASIVEVETKLLRPLVSGSRQVRRFAVEEPQDWLLFPYRDGHLIAEDEMRTAFPRAFAYLEKNREVLESRDGGRMRGSKWYGYSRSQNLTAIWQPKVLVPYMSREARAAADPRGELAIVNVTTGGYFVAPADPGLLPYLTAALNSRYAEAWWRKNATPHAGGYFGLTARAIGLLPVPDPAMLPPDTVASASTPESPEDDPFTRTLGGTLAQLK